MKKIFLLISLALLFVIALRSNHIASDEITVMTFNVRYGTAKDGEIAGN